MSDNGNEHAFRPGENVWRESEHWRARGWCWIEAVRGEGAAMEIKTTGCECWLPASQFHRTPPVRNEVKR